MTEQRVPNSPRIMTDLVHRLCGQYYQDSPLNHLSDNELPSRGATLQILSDLKDVLLPDYRLHRRIRAGQTGYIVGGILERVHEELRRQIFLARSYDYMEEAANSYDMEQADNEALAFLERLPELRELLETDVQAALHGDPAAHSYDEIIFCYPGFEAVLTYRIAHVLNGEGVPLLPRIMSEAAHSETGADIHPGARIGRSFFIDHATGVVIGETTEIGEHVRIYQGVTLGALSVPSAEGLRNRKRHPTIEDEVVIYAGATILGGETVIGRGSVIGGSCWITHSLPPGTKVVLQEPQMKFRGPKPPEAAKWEPDWSI